MSKESRKALGWSAALTLACALHASLFVLTESLPEQVPVSNDAYIDEQSETFEFSVALEQQRLAPPERVVDPGISQSTHESSAFASAVFKPAVLARGTQSGTSSHSPPKESLLPQISDFDAGNTIQASTSFQRVGVRGARSFGGEGISSAPGSDHLGGASASNDSTGSAGSRGSAGSSGSDRASALKVKLLASASCADLFPYQAKSDLGTVLVELTVDATGTSHFSKVLQESPQGQGFGRAAEKCAQRLRFSTSRNLDDPSLQAHPIVRLEFEKSS